SPATMPSGSVCSLSSSSVGERPASKWPGPSPRSRARPWPRTFAESIRAAPASSCSRRGRAPRPPFPRIFSCVSSAPAHARGRTRMRMGVDVRTSTRVINCDGRGVDLDRGRIDASTIIWAAGVVASPAARWLGAEHDPAGRVLVRPDLSVPNHPEIFVIGDAAAVHDEKGAMRPGAARAAKKMGRYVGRLIAARVAEKSSPPPFRYRSVGDLATIGRRAAVVKFGNLRLKGFVGWLFWSLAHIYFLIGVKNRFIVAFTWLWDYVTFHRGARLITEVPPPTRG